MKLQRITKKREEMFLTVGEEVKTDSGANAVASFLNLFNRLQLIEDILGDEYDLDRLRELVQADRDGRCVVLQVKPGEKVKPKQSPYRKAEIVDCVTIYTGGKITYGFHEIGMKETWVDRWEEEDAELYIPNEIILKEVKSE